MTDENLVFQSYGRCCKAPAFFDDFYATFLASSPEIKEKFLHTDMVAQKQLLRAGILNLVLYARGLPPTKLHALAASHSRDRLNIQPHLYNYWLEALLETVRRHDSEIDRDGLDAWRRVLAKGIEVIRSGY
ncbi:MAG: globin [Pseudomonas sp.]